VVQLFHIIHPLKTGQKGGVAEFGNEFDSARCLISCKSLYERSDATSLHQWKCVKFISRFQERQKGSGMRHSYQSSSN
jgi:hypothetical protein